MTPVPDPKRNQIRWWPPVLLLMLAAAAVWVISRPDDVPQQQKNMRIGMIAVGTLVLLLLWILLLSRMRWAHRLAVCGSGVFLVGLASATLKVEGVTGDLLPIVTWKWKKRPSEQVGDLVGTPETRASDVNTPTLPKHLSDYPQFLGPRRTAIVEGLTFDANWQGNAPDELWRRPIGPAWSGFAVKGMRAVTQEQRGEEEMVTCYDLLSGTLLWAHGDEAHYQTKLGGEGARATPTIDSQSVFTLGATGILNCLALDTGLMIWQRDIQSDANAPDLDWGYAGSPLVVNDMVIVNAGGRDNASMIAYHKQDGQILWSAGSAPASYSTPVLATLLGVEQVLNFQQEGLDAHELSSGELLWSFPIKHDRPHVAVPLIFGDERVMFSAGYGLGAVMLAISRNDEGTFAAQQLWKTRRLQSKFNNMVQLDGYVYGLHDHTFCCLDAATGERLWKAGRFGHGQQILANAHQLLATTESGGVKLIEPSPEGLKILAEINVFREKQWNSPALAGDILLLRTHKEAACYRLRVVPPAITP